MKLATLFAIAILLGTIPMAQAHQDRSLELTDSGEIKSLPAEYTPARFTITRQANGQVSRAVLQLPGGSFAFPKCMLQLFDLPTSEKLSLHASWYHDPKILPLYIAIDFVRERIPGLGFRGHMLLFDLSNARLLKLNETVVHLSDKKDGVGSWSKNVPAFGRLCPKTPPPTSLR